VPLPRRAECGTPSAGPPPGAAHSSRECRSATGGKNACEIQRGDKRDRGGYRVCNVDARGGRAGIDLGVNVLIGNVHSWASSAPPRALRASNRRSGTRNAWVERALLVPVTILLSPVMLCTPAHVRSACRPSEPKPVLCSARKREIRAVHIISNCWRALAAVCLPQSQKNLSHSSSRTEGSLKIESEQQNH
jgi:hypothetical protein